VHPDRFSQDLRRITSREPFHGLTVAHGPGRAGITPKSAAHQFPNFLDQALIQHGPDATVDAIVQIVAITFESDRNLASLDQTVGLAEHRFFQLRQGESGGQASLQGPHHSPRI